MPRKNIVDQTFAASDIDISGNGIYDIFVSDELGLTNANNLSVDIVYGRSEPVFQNGPPLVIPKYRLFALLETKDDAGNWSLLHTQSYAHTPSNPNNSYSLDIDPNFNAPDGKQIVDDTGIDGVTIVSSHRYDRKVPDNFRLKLQLQELGFGETGAFQEADILVAYDFD